MKSEKLFSNDFNNLTELFPKLNFRLNADKSRWIIDGVVDICGVQGDYHDSFIVALYVPVTYPYCVPLLKEISKIIPREKDWHITPEGFCCVGIDHELLFMSQKGINLLDFFKTKVYPYLANQLYRKENGFYASGEYEHDFNGVQQFYKEELKIDNIELAILILSAILSNSLPGRNDQCLCRLKKFKNCHFTIVEFLKVLPKQRLKKDLEEFQNLQIMVAKK